MEDYGDYHADTLEGWVIGKVDEWEDHYRSNYENRHKEYYRLWRGEWAQEDKENNSERSRIISPALQQAVESSVAEIEEATFGRGNFFDIRDDIKVPEVAPQNEQEAMMMQMSQAQAAQEKAKIKYLRDKLNEDFKKSQTRKNVGEVLINSAVYGTGIAELVVENVTELIPTVRVTEIGAEQGTEERQRVVVKLNPVQPQNFRIDPAATSVDDALGVAIDEYVSPHQIKMLQEQGVYLDTPVTANGNGDSILDADHTLTEQPRDKVRLTKYYGLCPRHLLETFKNQDRVLDEIDEAVAEILADTPEVLGEMGDDGPFYVETMIVIANGTTILKADENPFYLKDRPVIAFPWDVIPGRFWGRGVCEKGYHSQKALDTEIRARIDALALTNAPMMAMDATRMPRSLRGADGGIQIRPGRTILTNGNPAEVLQPFDFGNVSDISFAQADALQKMLQTATGAIDSAGIPGSINGEATAAGISMGLGAIIKRHKRTLVNFQDSFLIPMVKMSAVRYMQLDPESYPVADYTFEVTSSLGIIAREYEVTQLVQLLQTMGTDTPMYPLLVEAIIENMNLANREELKQLLQQASQPDPQQAEIAQAQAQAQIEYQAAQTAAFTANARESESRARRNEAEVRAMVPKLENDRINVLTKAAQADGNLTREDKRLIESAKLAIKERSVNSDITDRLRNAQQTQQSLREQQIAQLPVAS